MRVALGISYNGQPYEGWQSQLSGKTVQDKLEAALAKFSNINTPRVSTVCAGRTDAGVHGLMQVVHFDSPLNRPTHSWVRGTNTHLPKDIAVQWAHIMPDEFHCRANALSRRYAYLLLDSPVRPSVDAGRVGWAYHPLDMNAMTQAAQHLLGEHDFTSFRASACQALSPIKKLLRLEITRRGAYWRFEFEANAFLHHMIRNIMGCLVAVGQGFEKPEWVAEVLLAKRRDAAAPTFSPDGLYFLGPLYEEKYGLPNRTAAYDWLP